MDFHTEGVVVGDAGGPRSTGDVHCRLILHGHASSANNGKGTPALGHRGGTVAIGRWAQPLEGAAAEDAQTETTARV